MSSVVVPAATFCEEDKQLDLKTQQTGDTAKRGLDVCVVLAALLLLSPLIVFMALSLLVLQGRPIFIKHRRVGRGGKPFLCFKFRTMVVNGDQVLARHIAKNDDARVEWEMTRKIKNDPRVTPLGQVLRKTSVDELPQLFNILRGDMSLVGPRPIVRDEVVHYGTSIEHYYKVRPGLTGIWQISGRSDLSYKSRVSMDVEYVENRNLTRDLIIIAKTIPAVLAARGSC
ncbi:sugar transferase [Beijerinckia sp. L45]|uniref:sugar transferase n=1 Tax=Beijerinckia sp. L45 TaxID=1641855 RepID=UPI001FEEAAA3|nr:sugar transferase [Beijerinckia sp. L45]